MLNQTELTKSSCEQHEAARRNETVETTCTQRGNKETNSKVCAFQDSNKDTLIHQTQHVNTFITTCIRKYFRNLSYFVVKGKCINEQKQNMRNVAVEFKTGLEQLLVRRIAKHENLPDFETSEESISTNESSEEEYKNCTKEDKIRKIRALIGFNQCIENIVQELTTRNQSENSTQKTTNIQTNSKEEITQFAQTFKTSAFTIKRKTTFNLNKNQYFNYINNFDHFDYDEGYFDEVDANTLVNTTQTKTNNLIIHSNNNTNTLNTSNSNILNIKTRLENISTEKPDKTLITNNVKSNTISVNIPQPEETQHVSAQHSENLLVESEKYKIAFEEKNEDLLQKDEISFTKTPQETTSDEFFKVASTESNISETSLDRRLNTALEEHLSYLETLSSSTVITVSLRRKKKKKIEFDSESGTSTEESAYTYANRHAHINRRSRTRTLAVAPPQQERGFFDTLCRFFCCGRDDKIVEES